MPPARPLGRSFGAHTEWVGAVREPPRGTDRPIDPLVPILDLSENGAGDEASSSPPEPELAPGRGRRRRAHHRLRWAALAFVVAIAPVTYSYARALTGPGYDSVAARSVEWLRDHRMGGVVDFAERRWFASHQARVGGTPDAHVLTPSVTDGAGQPSTTATTAPARPARVAPTARAVSSFTDRLGPPAPVRSPAPDPFPGEGGWLPLGPPIHGAPGAYITSTRPDAIHLSSVVAVAWFDPHAVAFRQFPGVWIPGAPWDRPPEVPAADRSHLIATFSGGFRLGSSHGGMLLGGQVQRGLRGGAATLAVDRKAVPAIGAWGPDLSPTAPYDSVRQNLDLIVRGGRPNPALITDPNRLWGFTGPANHEFVWRSGAGVLANGALVWIGGPGLSISSLADLFVRLGAVRAMQLDINHEWVQFNTYRTVNGAVHGTRLLKDMRGPDDRWLSEDTRDFFAVFARD